jgi:hypothetical protein
MKRILSLVFIVSAGFANACAPLDEGLKTYVQKLNVETAKAYKTKDSHFFDTLFAPDFKAHDEHGVLLGRKEALFVVRFQLNTIKFQDYHATTLALKLTPARGTVVTQAKMMGLTNARHGHPSQKIQITRKWSDLYEKRGNQWQLVSRTELAAPLVLATPLTPLTQAERK